MESAPPTTTITLLPPPPFSWDCTLKTWYDGHHCLLCRRLGGKLVRLVEWSDMPTLLTLAGKGSTLTATFQGRLEEESLLSRVSRLLNLHWNRQSFFRRAPSTPFAPLARQLEGLSLIGFASLWEGIVACLISQQLSLTAALAIRNRLAETFGSKVLTTSQGPPLYTLPSPQLVALLKEEALRGVGLSRQKTRYLRELARLMAEGEFPPEEEIRALPRERAVERLAALPGLGEWSANYLLVRAYGHPDGFPASDAGLLASLQLSLGMDHRPTPAQAEELAAPFVGQRSLLTALLWTSRTTVGKSLTARC